MTDKHDRKNWEKKQDFDESGIDIKEWSGLNVEHQNTLSHEFVKFALTRVLYEAGREWDSEVRFPNGREADIVDLGPDDGKPVVYEVETNYTRADVERKLNHFHIGPVRDVIVLDPADVPADIHAAIEYLKKHEVIGA